jgi:purine nucleosidase
MRRGLSLVWLVVAFTAALHAQRLVLIDQDGSGPAGSNQMAMMALLQASDVRVLGITMVSGNAWEPEEVAHTLRMLELIHRTDMPVVAGAIYPLLRTREEAFADRARDGSFSWYGAWGDLTDHTSNEPYHAPEVIPPLKEGAATTHALAGEDAAHFILEQVHQHPHEVTLYAAGPLTNIALALALDPHLAELTRGIVIMGGSLAPQTTDPEYANHPRHEFNFWFDPEAAHLVLRAPWPRIDLTTVDISIKTQFSKELLQQIAGSQEPAAQYLARYTDEFYYMWDELAACAWIDPKIITKEQMLYLDVDLSHGPNYGDTLTWDAAHKPPRTNLRQVHVLQDLDSARFYKLFVQLMQAAPHTP